MYIFCYFMIIERDFVKSCCKSSFGIYVIVMYGIYLLIIFEIIKLKIELYRFYLFINLLL